MYSTPGTSVDGLPSADVVQPIREQLAIALTNQKSEKILQPDTASKQASTHSPTNSTII